MSIDSEFFEMLEKERDKFNIQNFYLLQNQLAVFLFLFNSLKEKEEKQ